MWLYFVHKFYNKFINHLRKNEMFDSLIGSWIVRRSGCLSHALQRRPYGQFFSNPEPNCCRPKNNKRIFKKTPQLDDIISEQSLILVAVTSDKFIK